MSSKPLKEKTMNTQNRGNINFKSNIYNSGNPAPIQTPNSQPGLNSCCNARNLETSPQEDDRLDKVFLNIIRTERSSTVDSCQEIRLPSGYQDLSYDKENNK